MQQHPGVLIAIETSTSGFASGVWSYAIHLGMKKIVASQVNAAGFSDNLNQSVKARSVNLECIFAFHTTQLPSLPVDWGDIVRRAQKRLKMFKFYKGPVDGILGPKTRDALRWFQRAEGLPQKGELDKATRKTLGVE